MRPSFTSILLYNIFGSGLTAAIRLAANWSPKAKLWVEGRKNLRYRIGSAIAGSEKEKVWVHCASLGEFEQGRPLIEMIKKNCPQYEVVLTFFSPSGYEIRKNYQFADHVFYLPEDTRGNALFFLNLLKPRLVVFVKYEFWYHYLSQLDKAKIPVILLSATFRKSQPFFKWYGGIYKYMVKSMRHVFVQDRKSQELLAEIGQNRVSVIPDTRIDRVYSISQMSQRLQIIESFTKGGKAIVGGSVYSKENTILKEAFDNGFIKEKIILAPHNTDNEEIKKIRDTWGHEDTVLYTQYDPNHHSEKKVLIINIVGILSAVYRYASLAVIGGGFGKSIHNILEPAAFGVPLLFGPAHEKFPEANDLLSSGGAFVFTGQEELEQALSRLQSEEKRSAAGSVCFEYIRNRTGGTSAVFNWCVREGILEVPAP